MYPASVHQKAVLQLSVQTTIQDDIFENISQAIQQHLPKTIEKHFNTAKGTVGLQNIFEQQNKAGDTLLSLAVDIASTSTRSDCTKVIECILQIAEQENYLPALFNPNNPNFRAIQIAAQKHCIGALVLFFGKATQISTESNNYLREILLAHDVRSPSLLIFSIGIIEHDNSDTMCMQIILDEASENGILQEVLCQKLHHDQYPLGFAAAWANTKQVEMLLYYLDQAKIKNPSFDVIEYVQHVDGYNKTAYKKGNKAIKKIIKTQIDTWQGRRSLPQRLAKQLGLEKRDN